MLLIEKHLYAERHFDLTHFIVLSVDHRNKGRSVLDHIIFKTLFWIFPYAKIN